jgi:mortality factor 4-like protein 1
MLSKQPLTFLSTVSLEELVVQTNLDQQSATRLKEELSKFLVWLARNAGKYFVGEYQATTPEYVERSRF